MLPTTYYITDFTQIIDYENMQWYKWMQPHFHTNYMIIQQ